MSITIIIDDSSMLHVSSLDMPKKARTKSKYVPYYVV